MKKIICALILSALTSSGAQAALPPFYEDVRQIKAILDDPKVAEKLGSVSRIQSIYHDQNTYTIATSECSLNMEVEYIPTARPIVGPPQLRLHVGDVSCLPGAGQLK